VHRIGVPDAEDGLRQAIGEAHRRCTRRVNSRRQGGWTLIKVAKPNQDMRFDVPSVGPATMENMHAAGGAVLAVEAGKTLVLEREKVLDLAGKYGIVIVALAGTTPADPASTTEYGVPG
jgi:UDP-2,3-diacylglucosamine hydrolase